MGKVLGFVAVMMLISACGHEKVVNDASNVAVQKGVISTWAEWVKDKGRKVDINFSIKNEATDKFIVVMLNDMSCSRNGHAGILKYTFFNTGERTIDLAPGQTKNANMVCTFPAAAKGQVSIAIRSVYDNPSKDRATAGKVIASDIVWTMSPQKQ